MVLLVYVCTHVDHVDAGLLPGPLGPPARLEVRPDALPGARRVLWELARARVDDGLDLLLRLPRNGDVPVQVLVHEQPHEHLRNAFNILIRLIISCNFAKLDSCSLCPMNYKMALAPS